MSVVNLYRSTISEFKLDYNTEKKRIAIGTSKDWVSLSPSTLRVMLTCLSCEVDIFRVTCNQQSSYLEILRLYNNFLLTFKSNSSKGFNTELCIPAGEARLIRNFESNILRILEESDRQKNSLEDAEISNEPFYQHQQKRTKFCESMFENNS